MSANGAVSLPLPSPRRGLVAELPDGDLFQEAATEAPIPLLPAELERYDTVVDNRTAREEADLAFTIYLAHRLHKVPIMPGTDAATPCRDMDDITIFFPEHPDEEFFPERTGEQIRELLTLLTDGERHDYRVREASWKISICAAKAACDGCPFRASCLTEAMLMDEAQPAVWGGWGAGGRDKIENKFRQLMRDYRRGAESRRLRRADSDWVGMEPAEMRRHEAAAAERHAEYLLANPR